MRVLALLGAVCMASGCAMPRVDCFGRDVLFLRKHTDVVVLEAKRGGRVAVLPKLQGRVITSTSGHVWGSSYGWVNRAHIESGRHDEHMNAYGGEDRFWLGPEGGQFSVFFEKDAPFEFEHWHTPAPIDSEPFRLVRSDRASAMMRKDMTLTNYSGTELKLRVDRTVRVFDPKQALKILRIQPGWGYRVVAYETDNRMTNIGDKPWTKETGLLSIWILGMFKPSPSTTVVVPFRAGSDEELGPIVNDTYFGKVPAERLVVKRKALYFKGDGRYRSKIGLTPQRALPVLGSYDASRKVLTIVQYNQPRNVLDYVNSMWELQDEPFKGDVVNSYNDGSDDPRGSFYELETSSPAAALEPRKSIRHVHRTYHFEGREKVLDRIARKVLGVSLNEIKNALPK